MKNYYRIIISVLFILSGFHFPLNAQSLFSKGFGTAVVWDDLNDTEKSHDGKSFFAVGRTIPYSFGDTARSFLIKMDTAGNIIWKKTFGEPDLDLRFERVFENSAGELIITGMFTHNKQCGLFLKTDANGNVLELKRYELTSDGEPTIVTREVVETSDGYAIIGYAGKGFNGWIVMWMRVDSSGNPLYHHQYGKKKDDHPIEIYRDDTSGYFMVSRIGNAFAGNDGFLRIYHLDSTGLILWAKNILPSFNADLAGCTQTADKNYLLVGNNADSSYLMKLNHDFEVLWIRNYPSSYFQSVTEAPDGSVWITGRKIENISEYRNTVTKTDSTGVVLFSKELTDYCTQGIQNNYYLSVPRSNMLCYDNKAIFSGLSYDCTDVSPYSEGTFIAFSNDGDLACNNQSNIIQSNLGIAPQIIYPDVTYNDSIIFETFEDIVVEYSPIEFYDGCAIPVGGQTIAEFTSFNVFPNPASSEVMIEIPDHVQKIIITDAIGRMVFTGDHPSSQMRIKIRDWNNGIYWIAIYNESGKSVKPLFVADK